MEESPCNVGNKLDQIHEWAHTCLRELTGNDLKAAHELGARILGMLDGELLCNAVKFLAVLEVVSVGADVLERESQALKHPILIN